MAKYQEILSLEMPHLDSTQKIRKPSEKDEMIVYKSNLQSQNNAKYCETCSSKDQANTNGFKSHSSGKKSANSRMDKIRIKKSDSKTKRQSPTRNGDI